MTSFYALYGKYYCIYLARKFKLEQRIYWSLHKSFKSNFPACSQRQSSTFEKWQDDMDAISTNLSSKLEFLIATQALFHLLLSLKEYSRPFSHAFSAVIFFTLRLLEQLFPQHQHRVFIYYKLHHFICIQFNEFFDRQMSLIQL